MATMRVGETLPAGTIVLLTASEWSDYEVIGLFRAPADTVIPGRAMRPGQPGEQVPDLARLSTLLEAVPYREING